MHDIAFKIIYFWILEINYLVHNVLDTYIYKAFYYFI